MLIQRLLKIAAVTVCLLTVYNTSKAQVKTSLKYVGSSTVANYIRNAQNLYGKIDFTLDTEPESAGGEQAILEGRCDLAGVAKVPRPEILAKGMVSTLIGWDAIAVITHDSNPVKNLSLDQLKLIFSGATRNWSELGGEDLPIQSYITGNGSATRKVFRSIVLGEANYLSNQVVRPDRNIIEKVKNDRGGIGHISFSFLKSGEGVNKIAVEGLVPDVANPSYPIKRPLYLLWWPGRSGVSDFISWTLSEAGQNIVKRDFVGISTGVVQSGNGMGTLVVYTQTYAVEDGGIFYYPHRPYEILNADRSRLKRVTNHRNSNDENPERVQLQPGVYIVIPEMEDGSHREIYVTIESGKTTSVDIEILLDSEDQQVNPRDFRQKTDLAAQKDKRLNFLGDFRFRGEQDWDSRRMDGSFRKNRFRLRYRLRFGFSYKWNDHFSMGARIRTGVPNNIQSPHFNVGYFGFSSLPFQLDRAYIQGKFKNFWAWAGKNNLPFWKQNELWWDDDVIPEGIATGGDFKMGRLKLRPILGFFITNNDHNGNLRNGTMAAGQIVAEIKTKNLNFTLATGFYNFDNLNNVPEIDDLFTETRYRMDFQVLNSGLKAELKGKLPLAIGLDLMHNLTDYSQDTLMNDVFRDQKTGFVGSILLGQQKNKGDWLFGYYFAYKQELSVVSYFAEDDWVRWGNINRNRNTNYAGHEVRIAYNFGPKFNAVFRGYWVNGLVSTGTSLESGKRLRLDLNIKF